MTTTFCRINSYRKELHLPYNHNYLYKQGSETRYNKINFQKEHSIITAKTIQIVQSNIRMLFALISFR